MKPEGTSTCQACGARVPVGLEFCPVCAFRGALEEGQETAELKIETPSLSFEHYQILTREDGTPLELGRGAMGVTYKAFDIDLRLPVTLKVISEKYAGDESARLRFLREARAAAKLRHTNVASVLHLGRTGSGYFYAMEFVEGETLESLMKRSGRLEVKLGLEIAAQVAAGLEAVQKQNLVHRDIKPSNIMVSLEEGGGVATKIIDLGLARGVGEAAPESAISVPGGFAGTPEFASPEQFAGVGVDIRSDLYSLGVTLWVMLTGRPPFRGTPAELTYQHQHGVLPLEHLKSLPQEVTALLERLLDKDPKHRFQTPAEFLIALRMLKNQPGKPADQKHEVQEPLAQKVSCRRRRSGREKLEERSVAVLPFESLSASKRDSYFADGVQDEILSNLAKISQLKVISRSSVMTYRPGANRNLRAIANELGVGRVIEGTVRRSGTRVRIATRLVNAQTGETLWGDSYDRDLTDIFAIQSEVAQVIATKLTATLSPAEKKRIEARPTDNLEAYDRYLQAKDFLVTAQAVIVGNAWKPVREAVTLLDEAIQLDPKFTLAYCVSATAHDLLYLNYDLTLQRRALADAAVNSALRLQPDLPEVHLAYAFHLFRGYRDYERAQVQLAIARLGLPNNSEAISLAAYMDIRQGNWEKAIQELNEALTLDPRNAPAVSELALSFFFTRRFHEAGQAFDRAIDLAPDEPLLKVEKAFFTDFLKTADDSALGSAIDALPKELADSDKILSWRLYLALIRRDFQKAEELIDKMKRGEDDAGFAFGRTPVPIGCYSILVARLQGELSSPNTDFIETRERLNQKVQKLPANAKLLSQLAVVDALLCDRQSAISEAKRAVEMLPISRDALDGPKVLANLAIVYAWTNELDPAFETLGVLTKVPNGVYYGDLKLDACLEPIRKDPRFENLLAQLGPKQSLQKMASSDPLDIKHEKLLETVIQPPTARRAKLPVVRIPERSIAVLPFDNLRGDKGDTYFADGVQDEILSNLAKISQLKVISRTSVMKYRSRSDRDLRSIARILRVANIVEGTVRKDGNRTRITVRLVDTRTDVTTWSETYDHDLSDIFIIQSEIAQMVASKLAATISPSEKKRIEAKPTQNLEAYDRYMRAKQLIAFSAVNALFGHYENHLIDAIALLEEAIRLDPKFTLAYCACAEANASLCFRYDWTSARRASADEAVKQALRLQPELPEVHLAYARHLYGVDRDYEKAKRELAIARRGLPNDVRVILASAWIDRRQGRWEEAIQGFREATSLDPRNVAPLVYLGSTLANLRRFADVEEIYNRAIDLEPDNLMLRAQKALWLTRKTGNIAPLSSVISALPRLTAEDPGILSWRLVCALVNRDWKHAIELITWMKGSDVLNFSYISVPVPVDCYLILLSRIQGERPSENPGFTQIRAKLCQKVQASPESAGPLSNLAVVDALLGKKHAAIDEAKRSAEMLMILQDAASSPEALKNLAVVYTWTGEIDLAFETLSALTKVPSGLYYGDLKLDVYWDPLRKDPRFAELLAELAPDD